MTQQIIPLIDQCGQCCTKILSFNLHIFPLEAGNTDHRDIFCQKQLQSEWPTASNPVSYQAYLFSLLISRGLSNTLEIRLTAAFHVSHSALHFLPSCWPYVTKIGAAVLSIQMLSQKLPKSMSSKKQDKKYWTSTTFPWWALWWSRRRRQLWRCTWDSVFRLFLVTIQTSFFW